MNKFIRNTLITLWYNGFVNKAIIDKKLFEMVEHFFDMTDIYLKHYLFHNK